MWGKNRDDQNVFYLHGALPFFDDGVAVIKEEYDEYNYLLDKISARMESAEYPIFVTAGDGRQKLTHIMHNRYLAHSYESLCTVEGSLVTFGFNFGEYDEHIIDAINRAARQMPPEKLWSVYIGVYSDDDRQHIEQIKAQVQVQGAHLQHEHGAGLGIVLWSCLFRPALQPRLQVTRNYGVAISIGSSSLSDSDPDPLRPALPARLAHQLQRPRNVAASVV